MFTKVGAAVKVIGSYWFYIMDHERLSLSLGASLERKSGKVWKKIQEKMHSLPPLLLASYPFLVE
jgi:hypothetical protein